MAYVTSDLSLPDAISSGRGTVIAALSNIRGRLSTYLEKRTVYRRTLFELQSYSRRDLLDLGIDPDGLDDLARQAAGF